MRGSTAMIEKERQSELIRKFVVSQEMPDDEIADLSLDELTYIYFNTEIAKKDEKYKAIHFPIKQQIIYWGVVDAIKKAETLYVAFTERPKYPYLDPGRNVWLFSTEDNLTRALKKLEEDRGMHLIYQKLPNQVIVPFFAQLYYWGIEQVIVDNMNHPMIVKRSDVMPEMDQKKDEKKQDLCNGKLQAALIQHAQFMAQNPDASVFRDDKEKLKVYTILANNVFFEVCDAKFMAPTVMEKDGKTFRAGEEIPEGARPAIVFMGKKDSDQKALPLFTDITEFMRVYKPHEMGISVMTYEAAEKMAKANNAEIVINRNGTGLTVNEHVMGLIDKIRAKKEEVKAKAAEAAENGEESASKPTPAPVSNVPKTVMPTETKTESASNEAQGEVTYGDLVDEPDMLIGALKRTAKATRQVKRMWLAQRVQGSKEGYLLVAETTSSSDTVLEQLKLAAKDYLNGKEIECRRADPAALAIVDNIKPFYKKGIFG